MRSIPSDIEIARSVQLSPISSIAGKLGLNEDVLEQYGKFKAKVLVNLFRRHLFVLLQSWFLSLLLIRRLLARAKQL